MSITRVATSTASATTVAMPTGIAVGDYLEAFAFRSGSTTAPTVPSGWVPINKESNPTATTCSGVTAYRYSTGSAASASQNTSTGVFTTAANTFVQGMQVQLTGTIPGGFAANTTYYVLATNLTSTTVELSATAGGAVKVPSSSASCTITSDFSGTWTNASQVTIAAYRPSSGSTILPGQSAVDKATTDTVPYQALSPMGDSYTGNSWAIGWIGASNLTQTVATAPSGMTNVTSASGTSWQVGLQDTNGGVTSWPLTNATLTGTAGSTITITHELVLATKTYPAALQGLIYHQIKGAALFNAQGLAGNNWTCPVLNPSGAGNTIVIGFTVAGGTTVNSVTGAVNGAFTQVASAIGGVGNQDSYVYIKQNVAAATETITISCNTPVASSALVNGTNYTITTLGTTTNWTSLGTGLGGQTMAGTVGLAFQANGTAGNGNGTCTPAVNSFQYTITEFYGVATSGGANGSATNAYSTTLGLASSFTPTTNNNANGGNVIWTYSAKAEQDPNNFTTGLFPGNVSGSTLFTTLSADTAWGGANPLNTNNPADSFPMISLGYVQPTLGAITPTFVSVNEAVNDHWNTIAIAIELSPGAGSAPPSSVFVHGIQHFSTDYFPAAGAGDTFAFTVSATGNARLVQCNDPNLSVQTVTDSEGNVYACPDPTNELGMWYAAGTSANPNVTIFATGGGADPSLSFRFWDLANTNGQPPAGYLLNSQSLSGLSSFTASPSPTPTISQGLMIAAIGVGTGPALGVTSPSGAIWDFLLYTGEVDADTTENADIQAHYYFTSPGAQTWMFNVTNIASNETAGGGFLWLNTATPPPSTYVESKVGKPGLQLGTPLSRLRGIPAYTNAGGTGLVHASGASASSGTISLTGAGALTLPGADTSTGTLALTGSGALTASGATASSASFTLTGLGALSMSGASTSSGYGQVGSPGPLNATGAGLSSGNLLLGAGVPLTGTSGSSGTFDMTSSLGALQMAGASTSSGTFDTSSSLGALQMSGASASSGSVAGTASAPGSMTAFAASTSAGSVSLTYTYVPPVTTTGSNAGYGGGGGTGKRDDPFKKREVAEQIARDWRRIRYGEDEPELPGERPIAAKEARADVELTPSLEQRLQDEDDEEAIWVLMQ